MNTKTWLIWALNFFLIITLTKNPFYLLIIFLIILLVNISCRLPSSESQIWKIVIYLGLIFIGFSIIFNTLTVHFGETVLYRFPESFNRLFLIGPIIGGKITLEALIYGFLQGFVFFNLLFLFSSFNQVINRYELIRLVPKFMHSIGIVISLAFAFIPQTITCFKEVKEAQMIRGVNFEIKGMIKRISNFLSILLPVIIIGIEKAVTLAESMESRAYGNTQKKEGLGEKLGFIFSLILFLTGFFLMMLKVNYWFFFMIGGLILIFITLIKISSDIKVTRYKREKWQSKDIIVVIVSTLAGLFFLWLNFYNVNILTFNPYPKVDFPDINIFVMIILLFMIIPTILSGSERSLDRSE